MAYLGYGIGYKPWVLLEGGVSSSCFLSQEATVATGQSQLGEICAVSELPSTIFNQLLPFMVAEHEEKEPSALGQPGTDVT